MWSLLNNGILPSSNSGQPVGADQDRREPSLRSADLLINALENGTADPVIESADRLEVCPLVRSAGHHLGLDAAPIRRADTLLE